jgi:hypothetical protein
MSQVVVDVVGLAAGKIQQELREKEREETWKRTARESGSTEKRVFQ